MIDKSLTILMLLLNICCTNNVADKKDESRNSIQLNNSTELPTITNFYDLIHDSFSVRPYYPKKCLDTLYDLSDFIDHDTLALQNYVYPEMYFSQNYHQLSLLKQSRDFKVFNFTERIKFIVDKNDTSCYIVYSTKYNPPSKTFILGKLNSNLQVVSRFYVQNNLIMYRNDYNFKKNIYTTMYYKEEVLNPNSWNHIFEIKYEIKKSEKDKFYFFENIPGWTTHFF